MTITVRTLRSDEGQWIKDLLIRMTAETPTAFRASSVELAQRTNEDWEGMADNIATSASRDGFVAEHDAEACGFVTGSILTQGQLAVFEGRLAGENQAALTDTTLLGTMWVAPTARRPITTFH